jgi:Transglycosylase SLT domain
VLTSAAATAALAVAALATTGPAAGSLSGLGSAGTRTGQAQVAYVSPLTGTAGPATARLDAAAASAAQAARQTARKMLGKYGWGARQFSPLDKLWNRESSWNKYAYNPSSGAYGIPQAVPGSKMASAGKHWRTNATTQIRWGLGYIKSVYGYPRRAWEHELAYGWY